VLPPLFTDNSRCLSLVSACQHSCILTVAIPSQPTYGVWPLVRCEAPGCIHKKFFLRLSSAGCFLLDSLIATSSNRCFCLLKLCSL